MSGRDLRTRLESSHAQGLLLRVATEVDTLNETDAVIAWAD